MRVLVVYAHPVETSFSAALHTQVLAGLREAGHDIDDLDLYAEGFEAVMSRQERIDYHDTEVNRAPVEPWVERVLAADAMILVHPVWNLGYPAILKGFFDRVFITGVSFTKTDHGVFPLLGNLKKIAVVCTYGSERWKMALMGDPPRKVSRRWLRTTGRSIRPVHYLALYSMNTNTEKQLTPFLTKVRRAMARF